MVAAMRAMATTLRSARALHTTASTHAFSKFAMPAMSPTMTEGGLAAWKVKEGQAFSAGDVLLEIETDKATMDVEAQDDGIMGKIVVEDGAKNVQVGQTIAVLAEEGDDLSQAASHAGESQDSSSSTASSSSSSAPSSSSSTPAKPSSSGDAGYSSPDSSASFPSTTSHSHVEAGWPILFPSVLRLLGENNVSAEDAKQKIKGTGRRGLVTKGDVLVFLGKASQPEGTATKSPATIADLGGATPPGASSSSGGKSTGGTASPDAGGSSKKAPAKPLGANELRAAIVGGLAAMSRSRAAATVAPTASSSSSSSSSALADAVADYQKPQSASKPAPAPAPKKDWLEGLI